MKKLRSESRDLSFIVRGICYLYSANKLVIYKLSNAISSGFYKILIIKVYIQHFVVVSHRKKTSHYSFFLHVILHSLRSNKESNKKKTERY